MEEAGLELPAPESRLEICSEAALAANMEAALGKAARGEEALLKSTRLSLYATPAAELPAEALEHEAKLQAEEEASLLIPPAKCWSAIHTHSRSEKVVAKRLKDMDVPHFLPLGLVKRSYGTRVRTSLVPLFPGYLFFDSMAIDRYRILDSKRVVRIIPCPEPEQLRRELTSIARILQVKPDLKRIDFGPPGSPVEVICGPFEGMQGELVSYEGKARLMIKIAYLALATAISIEEAWLKPITAEEANP